MHQKCNKNEELFPSHSLHTHIFLHKICYLLCQIVMSTKYCTLQIKGQWMRIKIGKKKETGRRRNIYINIYIYISVLGLEADWMN